LLHGLQPAIPARDSTQVSLSEVMMAISASSRPAAHWRLAPGCAAAAAPGCNVRKPLRFLARPAPPAAAGAQPFTKAFRREAVRQAGEGGGGVGDRLC
jgi:hypothetical protein